MTANDHIEFEHSQPQQTQRWHSGQGTAVTQICRKWMDWRCILIMLFFVYQIVFALLWFANLLDVLQCCQCVWCPVIVKFVKRKKKKNDLRPDYVSVPRCLLHLDIKDVKVSICHFTTNSSAKHRGIPAATKKHPHLAFII